MNTFDYIIKKYNLKTGSEHVIEIPNMDRNDLAKLFAELKFTKGAEIGVLAGRFSKILCETNPKLKLYSIDPWQSYKEYRDTSPQEEFDRMFRIASEVLAAYNCKLIKAKSMDAVKKFKDGSLDFVYIDGNHEFTSEANDIHEWSKKVRPGGIVSGHDYRHYRPTSFSHTYEVVNAYTYAYRIYPWFVTTIKRSDPIRSWFWVKT